jgi:hypothetical protein
MTAPRNKGGRPTKAATLENIKAENLQLKEVVNVLRVQIGKRECDFAVSEGAQYQAVIDKLKTELGDVQRAAEKLRGVEKRCGAELAVRVAQLTSEREVSEIALTKQMNIALGAKSRMIAARDQKLELAQRTLDDAAREAGRELQESAEKVTALELVAAKRLASIRSICGRLGGRPELSRTVAELEELAQSTSSMSLESMTQRVGEAIGEVGTDSEMAVPALMNAIIRNGYLDGVWESEVMWEMKMEWLEEKSEELSLAWDAECSRKVRDRLVISYDKMDELRFMLSHHRVGKQLVPRTWVINPWDGGRLSFPQPIRPRSGALGWARLIAATQKRYGLTMDTKGRIAQRSYTATVGLQFDRDQARGILKAVSKDAPLISVLGADGTGVGNRSMMHVANSIAPSYRDGISVENEKNINTIATSITDDHWGGLNETLCGGHFTGEGDVLPPCSIAAEINAMIATKELQIASPEGLPPRSVPVTVRGCFDLVAARGIRGGRGRCACHTQATDAQRFDVPAITDSTTWVEAKAMLDKHPMLLATEMRADSHTPPADWDYTIAPWKCKRAGCGVQFASHGAFRAARREFLAAKGDRTDSGKKVTAARAKLYAELHPSQQGEFEPPCTDLNMEDVLIDPLHCLLLNLPKVAWKYVFGDRMTNEQRELVAEYATPCFHTHAAPPHLSLLFSSSLALLFSSVSHA